MGVARGRVREGGWLRELDALQRGLTGGFVVGIPLLYTMETWWIGETVSMPRALLFLGLAYAVNLGFVTFAGFRRGEPGSLRAFEDALEATALAAVGAAVTLILLHQVQTSQPLDVIVGRIAVDTLPVSLGVSVANHILSPRAGRTEPGEGERQDAGAAGVRATLLDVGAAFAGALFLSLNIAPTEEVPMLATEVPTLHVPAIVFFSLLLTYAIVFAAGFGGQERRMTAPGIFQRPVTETVVAYLTSLATCVAVLWLYGQIGPETGWFETYAQVVLLGLPAAIGAAAGRLAL